MIIEEPHADDFPDLNSNKPTNVRWIVFVLCCGTSWMLYLHRYTFALIKPKLIEEWDLTKTQLGWMDTAFSMCYMAFQVPSGILADAFGAHFFLFGLIVVWSAALGLHALAPNIKVMVAARALFGIGQSGTYATLSKITRSWFPATVRTTVQGWAAVFSGRLGAATCNILFGTVLIGVVFSNDWRAALYILVAAGMFLGVGFVILFRDSPRKHRWVNEEEANLIEEVDAKKSAPLKPKRISMSEMFQGMRPQSILNLFTLNIQSILSTAADGIYSMWIPTFLFEVHELNFKEMGIYSSLPLFGGAIGGMMGGFLNDFFIRTTGNRRWSRSGVALFGKGMAGILMMSAMLFYDSPYRFCILLFFVKLFGDFSLTTSWGTVTDIGGRATATVFAFNNCIASLAGGWVSPIFGSIADNHGWKPVFVAVGIVYLACAASWLFVNCTIPLMRDEPPGKTPS